MNGKPRTRPMTRADVAARARHAREFLETASESLTLHQDRTNVAVSNAVLAGIAAADAICGYTLGESARGEDHAQAVRLLETAGPHGGRYASDLRRLLALKTNSQYSSLTISSTQAADAIRWATRLVDAMQAVLAGP